LFLDTVRRTVLAAEPTVAVSSVKTVEATMSESLRQRRLWGLLFTVFAGLALLLAVRGLVVREGLTLCAIGISIGIAASLASGRLATSILFGVTPYRLPTYATVVAVITVTVVVAWCLPALRASCVSPVIALRAD